MFFNKKERERSPRTNRESCAPVLCLVKCAKITLFLRVSEKEDRQRKIIRAHIEKADTGDFFAVFEPLSPQFLIVWRDSADRRSAPPGNSACNRGRSPGRPYYTASVRCHPGRRHIPAAIFCSGS